MNFEAFIVPVVMLFLGSGLTWVVALRAADRKADKDLQDKVKDLELQLSLVKQSVVPMSAAFQAILIKELTHFHTPVMDALLVKLGPPNVLTDAEEMQLSELLAQRSKELNGTISESERDAAIMLPMVVKRARAEETVDVSKEPIQLVVAAPTSEPEEAKK